MNHVYPWGKWGSRSNPNRDSILPEKPRPYAINEPKHRSWSSTGVSPSVVSATNTLKNFGLHPILEPPLRVSLDDCTHSSSLHEPMWVLAFTLLVHFTKSFMLMSKSCLWPCFGYAKNPRFMCTCCICCESMCHTHTWSHIHCRTSIIMVDQRLIMSVTLVTCTVSQSCWTCVSGWFESSRRQVM